MKADTKYIKEPINLKLMLSRSNLCSGLARTCGFALLLATGVSCASPQNVLTEAEAADGWELLFDGKTLESKKVPGLFCAGELLDVDGGCGGFNLQWAWASGLLAGESAAKSI